MHNADKAGTEEKEQNALKVRHVKDNYALKVRQIKKIVHYFLDNCKNVSE